LDSKLEREYEEHAKKVKQWQEGKKKFVERAEVLLKDPSFVSRLRRKYIEQLIQFEKQQKSAKYMDVCNKKHHLFIAPHVLFCVFNFSDSHLLVSIVSVTCDGINFTDDGERTSRTSSFIAFKRYVSLGSTVFYLP
jgi:hypothetical protein